MKSIGIIGGGYTGLTAAYRLSKLGYKVKIFERGDTLGGLAGGFKLKICNKEYPLEKAYHHLFSTDTDIIELAEELGIGDKLKFYDSSLAIYYTYHLYPFMSATDLLNFKPLSFKNRIRAGLVVYYLQRKKNWETFKHITAYDWMLKYAGKQVTEVIWQPLLKGKFHNYYDKVAMSWLWARINTRANSRNKEKEKLGYFDGGFETLTQALVGKFHPKGDHPPGEKGWNVAMELNANITQLKQEGDHVKVVLDSKIETFDKILATVPSYIFGKLIQNNPEIKKDYLELLESIPYLGAILMIFTSDKKISPYYWHNINEPDSPFLVFLNHTALVGTKMYDGKYVYYLGTYVPNDHKYFQMDDAEIAKLWKTKLVEIFPTFNINEMENINIFKFKNAQHVVGLDYESKIPPYQSPLKNIYLANYTQVYPQDRGTNFSVREGNKIAKMIHLSW